MGRHLRILPERGAFREQLQRGALRGQGYVRPDRRAHPGSSSATFYREFSVSILLIFARVLDSVSDTVGFSLGRRTMIRLMATTL